MSLAAVTFLQILSAIAVIAIFSAGLAIIFGMMGIINLAHGEFMMLGGYAALKAAHAGMNIWVAMLLVAPICVGLLGFVVERVLIRRLYGKLVDTLLATWGLSVFLIGIVTTVFGNTTEGVETPLGGFSVGDFRIGTYRVVLIGVALLLYGAFFVVLRYSRYGLIARATMQNREMTAAMGLNPRRIYSATFTLGAAVTGLAGGLMAPITGIIPTMGAAFVAKAFITVICGGPGIILGSITAAALFGTVNHLVSYVANPVTGEAAILLVAILLLRFLPNGLSSCFRRVKP